MRCSWLALPLALFMLAGTSLAHLCNNIFRVPDRIIVKPEKPLLSIEKVSELRVFVQNNYPAFLHDIKLSAHPDTPGLATTVTPESVPVLKAAERVAFTVRVAADNDAPKKVALKFSISAKEFGFRPVQEPNRQELRAALLSPPNYGDNVLAAESLVRHSDPTGAQWLIEFMNNTRVPRDFRSRAIRALGKAADTTHIPALRAMLECKDGFLRGNALLALGCMKSDAAVFAQFSEDRDEFVRVCALAGSCLAGHKAHLPSIRQSLTSPDVFVRIASGWALAAHRDMDGIRALEEAFATQTAIQQVMAGDALTHVASLDRQ